MSKIFVFVLAIFLAAGACAEQAPATSPSLTWQRAGSTSYEARFPGLGASQRYTSPAGWVDVYVYDLRRNDWQPGVSDPQFAEHFESTVEDVRHFAQRGLYAGLEIDAARDVEIAGNFFRTIRFRFFRDGKPILSATYLTAQNGHLLKYRVSLYAESGLDVAAVTESFIEESLRAGHVDGEP